MRATRGRRNDARATPHVRLRAMTGDEARAFASEQDAEYARQKVNAGDWPADDALRRARDEHAMLHDGSWRAKGHALFVGEDAESGARVGVVWVGPSPSSTREPDEVFVFQFTVDAERRGQGWGRAMLDALVERLRAEGARSILLNVFHWNGPAIALYAAAGFGVERDFGSSMHMRKRLA